MDDMADFVTDAHLSFAPLEALGWSVDMVPWRQPGVCWDDYDAVYICTPWDYPEDPQAFLRVLDTIDRSRACLINCLELVRWSLGKTYLRDLESRGARIVPSLWYAGFDAGNVAAFFSGHSADVVVLKPVVGANAVDTYVLENPVYDELESELAGIAALIQAIAEFSHTVTGNAWKVYLDGEHETINTFLYGDD